MDLSTKYMGFDLSNPLMPGASPLSDDLDAVKKLEDQGAAAIVMHSLFEEQLRTEQVHTFEDIEGHAESFAESLTYFPEPVRFSLGPEEYLEKIKKIKECIDIPLFASLNGTTKGGWTDFARLIEEAGADALEINVYYMAMDPSEKGTAVEFRAIEILKALKEIIKIPVAVKISPFFSSTANFVYQLEECGANAVVMFNRFFQPDIDVESLEAVPRISFSDSSELLLRIRWLAAISGQTRISLAATGGVHTEIDAIKAIMAGADAVQMVSALLKNGTGHLGKTLRNMEKWMKEHEYESILQMKGNMSLEKCPDPSAYMRANYMRMLQHWRV